MQIRPAISSDLDQLSDIDGTINSSNYLHVEKSGEGFGQIWKLQERPLRSKLIESNPVPDDTRFAMKQIIGEIEEGMAIVADHSQIVVGCLIAQIDRTKSL